MSDLLPGGNVVGEGGSEWIQNSRGEEVYVTGQVVTVAGGMEGRTLHD